MQASKVDILFIAPHRRWDLLTLNWLHIYIPPGDIYIIDELVSSAKVKAYQEQQILEKRKLRKEREEREKQIDILLQEEKERIAKEGDEREKQRVEELRKGSTVI